MLPGPVRSDRLDPRAALVVDVEGDGEQQHETLDGLLPLDPDAHDRHAVVEHADDQTTDDGAADGADATLHGRAADEGRGDRFELEAVTGLRAREVEACGEDQT